MDKSDVGRPIVLDGPLRSIHAAVRLAGDCPSVEFLDGLSDRDQIKLAALFRLMGDQGKIVNREKFKHLSGEIWQFKSYQICMPCYQVGRVWVLTHGFIKKQDDTPPREIKRAEEIMNEDLQRASTLRKG
jgi:hypothetical protein